MVYHLCCKKVCAPFLSAAIIIQKGLENTAWVGPLRMLGITTKKKVCYSKREKIQLKRSFFFLLLRIIFDFYCF